MITLQGRVLNANEVTVMVIQLHQFFQNLIT